MMNRLVVPGIVLVVTVLIVISMVMSIPDDLESYGHGTGWPGLEYWEYVYPILVGLGGVLVAIVLAIPRAREVVTRVVVGISTLLMTIIWAIASAIPWTVDTFLIVLGTGGIITGILALFGIYNDGGTIFQESVSYNLIGFGGVLIGLGHIIHRMPPNTVAEKD